MQDGSRSSALTEERYPIRITTERFRFLLYPPEGLALVLETVVCLHGTVFGTSGSKESQRAQSVVNRLQ